MNAPVRALPRIGRPDALTYECEQSGHVLDLAPDFKFHEEDGALVATLETLHAGRLPLSRDQAVLLFGGRTEGEKIVAAMEEVERDRAVCTGWVPPSVDYQIALRREAHG